MKQCNSKEFSRWINQSITSGRRSANKFPTMHHKYRNYCLRWIPTGRMFKQVGSTWILSENVLNLGKSTGDVNNLKFTNRSRPKLHVGAQICDDSAGTSKSTAGYSYSHHVRGLTVWRPVSINPPKTGSSTSHL